MASLAKRDLPSPLVIPLAWTRADVDPSYVKLDLMDQEAVEGFFSTNKADCESATTITRYC